VLAHMCRSEALLAAMQEGSNSGSGRIGSL